MASSSSIGTAATPYPSSGKMTMKNSNGTVKRNKVDDDAITDCGKKLQESRRRPDGGLTERRGREGGS